MLTSLTKVFKCIHTSCTIEQLETTRKLMNNFFRLYDIDVMNKLEIELELDKKYKRIYNSINKLN